MGTHEILRKQWEKFLDDFSRDHSEGWSVTVEILGGEMGHQVEVNDLPFQGVSADPRGRDWNITIWAGDRSNKVAHVISSPTRLRYAEAEGSADSLEIESEDGTTTIAKLRPAGAMLGMAG